MRSRKTSSTGCISLLIEEEALCANTTHTVRSCSLKELTDSWRKGDFATANVSAAGLLPRTLFGGSWVPDICLMRKIRSTAD
jgi:hypothetical protein